MNGFQLATPFVLSLVFLNQLRNVGPKILADMAALWTRPAKLTLMQNAQRVICLIVEIGLTAALPVYVLMLLVRTLAFARY